MELTGVRVLALGTRGAQGTGLVEALRGRGAVPVLGSSDEAQVSAWREAGQEAVLADLRRPGTIRAAAAQVPAVVLHRPVSMGAPHDAAAVEESIAAAREAGAVVAVNVGSPVPSPGAPDPFGVGVRIKALGELGVAIVAPTAYLDNHAAPWALGPLHQGELIYPRPPQDVLAWVAARDMTAAAVAALAADLSGEVLQLAGPQALTFEQLAAEIGAGLGREITFRRVTPEEFGELLRPVLGPQAAAGVSGGYASMPEESNPAMAPDASAAWQRLGVQPTTARDWAASTLAPLLSAH